MIHGLLGRKIEMTQLFAETGEVIPVTVVQAGPCPITQLKKKEKDGYNAIQIGFEEKKKNVTKPMLEKFKKVKVTPQRFLREIRQLDDANLDELTLGSELSVDVFEVGDIVDVVGTTKGKGFAGTIKRHGFTRGPESHGSMNVRKPGSIGSCSDPSRVFKGMKMGGHMGDARNTVKNLTVVRIDKESGLLFIKGGIPGATNSLVFIRDAKTGSKPEQSKRPLLPE